MNGGAKLPQKGAQQGHLLETCCWRKRIALDSSLYRYIGVQNQECRVNKTSAQEIE